MNPFLEYMNCEQALLQRATELGYCLARCDVNVSVAKAGSDTLGTKVEVKNMNSFSNMQKAIDFEVERQVRLVCLVVIVALSACS